MDRARHQAELEAVQRQLARLQDEAAREYSAASTAYRAVMWDARDRVRAAVEILTLSTPQEA